MKKIFKFRKISKALILSFLMLLGLPYSALADDNPYGPHPPEPTDVGDFDISYLLAAISFIVGISLIIYSYYLKKKLSKIK